MTTRTLLCLLVFAQCVLLSVTAVALADAAEDAGDTEMYLTGHRIERRSLTGALMLSMRSEEAQSETETTPPTGKGKGRLGGKRRRKGRGNGKEKGKGKGKGRRNNKGPQYANCLHPSGFTCTCDMRYAKFKDDPVKKFKYFTIC